MNARLAFCTALLALAAGTAGCSGSGGDEATEPDSIPAWATATPGADQIAQRQACIDAWAEAVLAHPKDWSPGEEATPEECQADMGWSITWAELYVAGKEKGEKKRLELPPIDDGASITAEG
ncbi:hypothetical protein [Streptomyces sp. NPDC001356]